MDIGLGGRLGGRAMELGPTDRDDRGAQAGVRRQDAMIAMAVDVRGRNELGQSLQELEGGEQELGATVHVRLG